MYLAQSSAHPPAEPVQPVQQYTQPIQPAQYTQPIQHPQPVHPYQPTQQSYDPLITNDNSYIPSAHNYPPQPPRAENYNQHALDNAQPIQRRDSNTYGNWMAPAAGGVATGALASEAYRKKQLAQQHLEAQEQQQQYPVEQPRLTGYSDATPVQNVPARHPDHILPDQIDDTGYVAPAAQQSTPAPIIAPTFNNQTQMPPQQNTGFESPQTTSSFLGESDVGAAPTFGQTINGGPVPVELVDTAAAMAHPGMGKRMNTDISVSDLHVPGEYPRTEGTVSTRTPEKPKTLLSYS